jgi:hypothetical protein
MRGDVVRAGLNAELQALRRLLARSGRGYARAYFGKLVCAGASDNSASNDGADTAGISNRDPALRQG